MYLFLDHGSSFPTSTDRAFSIYGIASEARSLSTRSHPQSRHISAMSFVS